jgi:beta-N-acetylhexosaminidase
VIYSYKGLTPPAVLLNAIRHGEAAGVIFFSPNIASRTQLRAVIATLERADQAGPIHAPLLLMTDQEGGVVRRLPGAPEASEKRIGTASNAVTLARAAGRGAATNLASTGLNVNLAPVLDVFQTPGNFIDEFERSYSSNPTKAAGLGAAFITAQQALRVAATAKHFPGLGTASRTQNTDKAPVTLPQSLAAIRGNNEMPYRAAIAAGVRLVMMSWATYPSLDPTLPAGLSPTVVEGELRHRLGFTGVTITDSLEAGSLQGFGAAAERALLAVRAGDDLVLCSGRTISQDTPALGLSALSGIVAGLASSEISRLSAERAAAAVIELRHSL